MKDRIKAIQLLIQYGERQRHERRRAPAALIYTAFTLAILILISFPAKIMTQEAYRIVVNKAERKLYLYHAGKLTKTYSIALGGTPKGRKRQQGDGATPEGDYYITHKNSKSKFYLSLGVSYPNVSDAATGLKNGLITKSQHDAIVTAIRNRQKPPQNTALGGDIFIHGGGTASDWTLGCVALENKEIKELFDLLPTGTPVRIEP